MNRVIIEEHNYNGIPYNKYFNDQEPSRGLVIIQHGFESNKNRGADYLAVKLARRKYTVISVDAFKHGERIEEPFITQEEFKRFKEAFNVIKQTAEDIVKLYDEVFSKEFDNFDLIGVSMGGMIAYHVAMLTGSISKLIPVISTPMIDAFAMWLLEEENNIEFYKAYEEMRDTVSIIDPVDKFDQLKYDTMLVLNGTQDKTVPHIFSQDYFAKHHTKNIEFKLYEDKHIVNKDMQKDIIEFITNEKVVL